MDLTDELFEIDQRDYDATKRHLKKCKKDVDRDRQYWSTTGRQDAVVFNLSIETVGKSYCSAVLSFNRAAMAFINDDEAKRAHIKDNLLALYDLRSELEDIIKQGVTGNVSAWRTDVLMSIICAANEAILEIKQSVPAPKKPKLTRI